MDIVIGAMGVAGPIDQVALFRLVGHAIHSPATKLKALLVRKTVFVYHGFLTKNGPPLMASRSSFMGKYVYR